MHGSRWDITRAQAASVGLPLWRVDLPSPCSNSVYATRMAALISVAQKERVTHIAFGDLHLADVRAYREATLAGSNVKALFPIWQVGGPSAMPAVAASMFAGGAAAITCSVDARKLGAQFCGRRWDAAYAAELEAAGADACGENGEFHSVCVAGPAFSYPLILSVVGEPLHIGEFWYSDLVLENDTPLGIVAVHLDEASVAKQLADREPADVAAQIARATAIGEALCPTPAPPTSPDSAAVATTSCCSSGSNIKPSLPGTGLAVSSVPQ